MTLKQCYQQLGGNYDDVLARLGNEKFVERFILKFLEDKTFDQLSSALNAGDTKAAFVAAHTLKGVCQTLGMDKIVSSSSAICEELREGNSDVWQLFETVSTGYKMAIEAITQFKNDCQCIK